MIRDLWSRLERWADNNALCMLEDLNPGASIDEIAALEQQVGRKLPAGYRESLLLHNGERSGWPCSIFADLGDYLSIAEVIRHRVVYEQVAARVGPQLEGLDLGTQVEAGVISVDGPVRPVMFSPDWIPIMDFNADIFRALDFDHDTGGLAGQMIEVDWKGTSWRVVAGSFGRFLSDYVAGLEAGRYRIVDGRPTKHDF